MKLCEHCKERQVDSPRGKYCAECREALGKTGGRYGTTAKAKAGPEKIPFRECTGCQHWRDCGNGMRACHLTIDTGVIRTVPREICYRTMCK